MPTETTALRIEAMERLLRFMPNQYLGGIIVVSAFIAFFTGRVADAILLGWGGFVLFLYVTGFLVLYLIRNVPKNSPAWTVFALGYGVGGGAVWGVITMLLYVPGADGTSHILTPALIGLAAIGVAGLISYMPSVWAFLASALGPLAFTHWQARAVGDVYPVLALLVVACAIGFTIAAMLTNRQLIQSWLYRRALEGSEGRFRDFAESASEWYWETDAENRLSYVSDAAVTLRHTQRDAILGFAREDLALEDRRANPDRWQSYLDAVTARKPFRNFVYPVPLGKAGSDLWVSISGVPVFDNANRFIGYRGTGRDLTGERESEEKLRLAQSLLADAVESFPAAFMLFDKDERLVLLNSTAAEWYKEIIDVMVLGETMTTIARAFRSQVSVDGVANDRMEQWIEWRMDRFRHPSEPHIQHLVDGRHTLVHETRLADGGTVSVRTDITDLVEAQTAAAEANRSKSEFLANMSHELRTPLNAIIGFADAIGHEVSGPIGNETYEAYVSHIHQSGLHLLSLISDILDVSAVEAGRITLTPSEVDVPALITQCLTLVRTRADDKGVKVGIDVPKSVNVLEADERRVKQVVINILNNAVKFTPPGGRIDVSVGLADDGGMVIAIADSGPGLSREEQHVAMSPFGRTRHALETAQEGTGLGLPLSKSLMEAHGGQLIMDSAPGQGCAVSLVFPAERVLKAVSPL